MKKIIIPPMLLFSLSLHAQLDKTEMQADSLQVKLVQLPDSTAVGAPDGNPVSKEIGAAGGTIISDDGKVELIFPAGALTAKKTISIQPVVNLIPNGNGKAYRFEPSGLHFTNPVEVIFHYTKEEENICPALLKFMAIQSANGKWEYKDYDEWDSSAMILVGFLSHFSVFGDGNEVEWVTESVDIKVGKRFLFYLKEVTPPEKKTGPSNANDEDDLPALPVPNVKFGDQQYAIWSVNGINGGTGQIGTIHRVAGKNIQANYTAPNFITNKDVTVTLKVKMTINSSKLERGGKRKRIGGLSIKTESLATFTGNVHLWDEYRITIIKKGPSILRCEAELEDRSSFTVKFYPNKKPEISDVTNSEPTLTKLPDCRNESRGGRGAQYTLTYDPGGCQGPVHVSGNMLTGYGMLTNDQAAAPPDITIEFVPSRVKIMNGKIHFPGTPGAHTNSHFLKRQLNIPTGDAKDEPADEEGENVGNKIKFIGNRQHQEYDRQDDDIKHSFKLIIEPL